MNSYDCIVSSVHDRGDLLERTLRSMLVQLDQRPARIIVHEDVRPDQPFVAGRTQALLASIERDFGRPALLLQTNPGGGLGRAMLRLLRVAETPWVFYTQEDFDFVRPTPAGRCLELCAAHDLWHVRFNKRKTMAVKGADRPPESRWTKKEVQYGGQTFCVSDHWYFQGSLWKRDVALRGFEAVVAAVPEGRKVDFCEVKFNHWINTTFGGDRPLGCHDGEQERRQELARSFIWGGVAEPAFIQHTGHDRRSQGWEPRARSRDS